MKSYTCLHGYTQSTALEQGCTVTRTKRQGLFKSIDSSFGSTVAQWVFTGRAKLGFSAPFSVCLLYYLKLWVRFLLTSTHRYANHFRSISLKAGNARLSNPKLTCPISSPFKVKRIANIFLRCCQLPALTSRSRPVKWCLGVPSCCCNLPGTAKPCRQIIL